MLGDGLGAWRTLRRAISVVLVMALLLAASTFASRFASANGSDLPPQILLQAFVKPEDGRLELIARIPTVLLGGFNFPKRGPGYLDLARIDDRLRAATAATARQIELFENGVPLVPARSEARIALPSDSSFSSYATARAHVHGPTLPADTDLYSNQGFLDVALEYPIRSPRADFSVRVNVAPELGQRVKLHLEFLSAGGPIRVFDLPGRSWRVPLDPRWYQAAWTFVRNGFVLPFSLDRLVFLLCLAAPFRQLGGLLAVVMALSGLQAASLTAGALSAPPDPRVMAPLLATCLAVGVLFLAFENAVAPSLRRRWFIASVVGVLSGFDFGHALLDDWQYAGAHTAVSAVAFNLGVALGEVTALVLAFIALGLVFTYVTGKRLGVIVLSIVLGHTAWHWMLDSGHLLGHAAAGLLSTASVAVVAWWILVGLLVGGFAWFLPERFVHAEH
jgi:HupE/UreJ protein